MKLRFFWSALVLSLGLAVVMPQAASAFSGADFKPGRIIDDSVFYNKSSMSVNQIQQFLNSKVPTCDRNGTKPSEYGGGTRAQYGAAHGAPAPYTCLKDYYENTTTKQNNLEGRAVPAGAKSAAQIIWDAAQEHSINPQVLIVLLQKEQALVLDEWPFPVQYRSAAGYGCPDTAPCDTDYYGFYNQVTSAAWQFRRYATHSNEYNHIPGQNNQVRWSPDASCGSSTVFITNQATASLYNYTPYRPNQAALDNLYGTGDSCSAYGNRNFWRMFNDWFGSTHWVNYKLGNTSIKRIKKKMYGSKAHQLFAATDRQILSNAWWPGSGGVHTDVVATAPFGQVVVDFDKINHADGTTQSVFMATNDGVYQTKWNGSGYGDPKRIIDRPNVKRIIATVRPGTPATYNLYVLASDGPYEYWWRDGTAISDPFRFWNINNGIDMVKSVDASGKDELYVATKGAVYRMKWPVSGDIQRKTINTLISTVGIDKQTMSDGKELLYTATQTGVHETTWQGSGPLSDNVKIINAPDTVVGIVKANDGAYHNLYLATKRAAYEYWWLPGDPIRSGRLVGRDLIVDLDKTKSGAYQNLYTTSPTAIYETWWGRGNFGTGAIVKFE